MVETPGELQVLLNKNKTALNTFNALSFSHKKEYVEWILSAKKEETKTGEINIELKLNERREELRNFTFEFLNPEDFGIIDQTDKMIKIMEPTVDEILEKITEEGIESLTETEKEILNNYGKRKNGGN